jgi:hypothetical protein
MTRWCFDIRLFKALMIALLASPGLLSSPIVIDFEGLSDGTFVTTQFSNLTFSNAVVSTAGISLNELEFPPESGSNVIVDFGGPISITFASPISSFGGFFTYLVPVTIQAFDSSNHLLASSLSQFSNNLACLAGPPCPGDPGSSPDEFIHVDTAGLSSVVITGAPAGSSFALDDVTYSLGPISPISSVPEPSSLVLLTGIPLLLVFGRTRLRRARSRSGKTAARG